MCCMKTIALLFLYFICLPTLHAQNGVAPGIAAIFGPENGINTRFYYFPNEHSCFGPEVNFFPSSDGELADGLEIAINGHYIFEITHKLGMYPIAGAGWKRLDSKEDGWRANLGLGLHWSAGRFVPYSEYIYSLGFEDEGVFLIGTFFTFGFHNQEDH